MIEGDIYEPPKSDVLKSTTEISEIKRGGCLTAFLVFIIIANALYVTNQLWQFATVHKVPQGAQPIWAYIFCAGAFLSLILALMTWFWKKIGVFGFAVVTMLMLFVELHLGYPQLFSVISVLVWPVILILLVMGKWKRFN